MRSSGLLASAISIYFSHRIMHNSTDVLHTEYDPGVVDSYSGRSSSFRCILPYAINIIFKLYLWFAWRTLELS